MAAASWVFSVLIHDDFWTLCWHFIWNVDTFRHRRSKDWGGSLECAQQLNSKCEYMPVLMPSGIKMRNQTPPCWQSTACLAAWHHPSLSFCRSSPNVFPPSFRLFAFTFVFILSPEGSCNVFVLIPISVAKCGSKQTKLIGLLIMQKGKTKMIYLILPSSSCLCRYFIFQSAGNGTLPSLLVRAVGISTRWSLKNTAEALVKGIHWHSHI